MDRIQTTITWCLLSGLLTVTLIVSGVFLRVGKAKDSPAVVPMQEKSSGIAGLSWLAGDWETRMGQDYVEEHWTAPAGGTMLGMSRTVAGEKTKFFEYLRIDARADAIYYVAHPQARPGVDFRLARMSPTEVIFENPGHTDHLKHIIYRKESQDGVTARIEGSDNGKDFAVDYHYRRMPAR